MTPEQPPAKRSSDSVNAPGYPNAPLQAPATPPDPASGAATDSQASQNPPNPVYPAYAPVAPYPPYPMYPPNTAYPGAPYPQYPYPAAPSYPLYSPYAPAPYGAPAPGTYPGGPQMPIPPQPTPPTRRRRLLLPAILGGVAAVVIIAVVAAGLLALGNHGNPTTNATPTATPFPTATTQPAATTFPGSAVYSDAVPGVCGDHPNDWNTDTSGASVACANGVMTLTDPSSDKYVAAEYFQPANYSFPSQYAASVTVTNLTNACGGILVLGNRAEGYAAYLCTDGHWGLYSYDATGNSTTIDSGYYGVGGTYTMVMALSPGKLDVSINGAPITTTQPTMTVSNFLGLQVYPSVQQSNATADFSNFAVTA